MKTRAYGGLIVVLGLVSGVGGSLYSAGWWGLKPAAPVIVAPTLLETKDFYFFAQKQAELYRGELLTCSEMKRFVKQTKEQIRLWGIKHPNAPDVSVILRHLNSLQSAPYSIKVNQQTLHSFNYLSKFSQAFGLQQKCLQVHMARLLSIADSYQE